MSGYLSELRVQFHDLFNTIKLLICSSTIMKLTIITIFLFAGLFPKPKLVTTGGVIKIL